MLFGRKLRVKVPQVRDIFGDLEERDCDTEVKSQMIVKRNGSRSPHDFEVGDLVLLKRDTPNVRCLFIMTLIEYGKYVVLR